MTAFSSIQSVGGFSPFPIYPDASSTSAIKPPLRPTYSTYKHLDLDTVPKIYFCTNLRTLMTSPVLGFCGHTFEKRVVQEEQSCAIDHSQLSLNKSVSCRELKSRIEACRETLIGNQKTNITNSDLSQVNRTESTSSLSSSYVVVNEDETKE